MDIIATVVHPKLRLGGHCVAHWYEFVLLPVAALVVYADKVLLWASRKADKTYGWRHLVSVEALAVGVLVLGTALLVRTFAGLVWWDPIALVAFWAAVRVVAALVFSI